MKKFMIIIFTVLTSMNLLAQTVEIYECSNKNLVVKLFKNLKNSSYQATAFDIYDHAQMNSCTEIPLSHGIGLNIICNGIWGSEELQFQSPASFSFYFSLNPYSTGPKDDIRTYGQINRNPAWTQGNIVHLECHNSQTPKDILDQRKCWYPDDSNPNCL